MRLWKFFIWILVAALVSCAVRYFDQQLGNYCYGIAVGAMFQARWPMLNRMKWKPFGKRNGTAIVVLNGVTIGSLPFDTGDM